MKGSKLKMKWALTVAYFGVIVAANYATSEFGLVPIGFGLLVTAGTFFAGVALIVRDGLQVASSRAWLLSAIVVGAVVSAFTSGRALALASGVAFLVSEFVDWGVFTPLRDRGRIAIGVVASSLVAAPIDTVLFLHLAGFPVTVPVVLGQVLVKTGLALLVVAVLAMSARVVP